MRGLSLPRLPSVAISLFLVSVTITGCQGNSEDADLEAWSIRQEKSNSATLARFYLGGLLNPATAPESTGLAVITQNRILVDKAALDSLAPEIAVRFIETARNGRVSWDKFESILASSYYARRNIPDSLSALKNLYWTDTTAFFNTVVDGAMTNARRHIFLPEPSLRKALALYPANDERLLYPVGTLIIGEHREGADILETTAMVKREDGFWDFVVYDSSGFRADSTTTPPKALQVPTQCTGCHFGSRAFEPEKSFPARAPAGPDGPRQIFIDGTTPPAALVAHFDEHRKRSDYVLGLYATLYTSTKLFDESARDSLVHAVAGHLVND